MLNYWFKKLVKLFKVESYPFAIIVILEKFTHQKVINLNLVFDISVKSYITKSMFSCMTKGDCTDYIFTICYCPYIIVQYSCSNNIKLISFKVQPQQIRCIVKIIKLMFIFSIHH